jgi:putative peptidoglycan lipid II flippase
MTSSNVPSEGAPTSSRQGTSGGIASGIAWIRDRLAVIVPRGAILLSVLTFAGYFMGLVRDRTFARTFGASAELDAYNAALVLPELTLSFLVLAGLTAAFVPMFTRTRQVSSDAAEGFSRTVLTAAILLMAVAAAILFVIAPATVDLVAPGFDAAQRALYTELFRMMCVTAVIFAASFAIGEMLVSRQRFVGYGLAPLLYNGGIVLGTIVLGPRIGIYGAAVGTVIGALLHLVIRLLDILRTDASLRPLLRIRDRPFVDYVRLSIPKSLSQPIEPLTFAYFTSVASTLAAGSVSAVSFARNFQSVPVSLIGIAFAVAAFPIMSRAAAAGDRPGYVRSVTTNLATITLLTVVAGIALYFVAYPAIDLLLGGEEFDADDVALTSSLLAAFALSVPLESMTHLLSRAIYATRNTILPVIASIAGLVATVLFVSLLIPTLGVTALPLGFAAGMGLKVLVLVLALIRRVRSVVPPTPEEVATATPA